MAARVIMVSEKAFMSTSTPRRRLGPLYLDGVGGEFDLAAHFAQDFGEAEVALR